MDDFTRSTQEFTQMMQILILTLSFKCQSWWSGPIPPLPDSIAFYVSVPISAQPIRIKYWSSLTLFRSSLPKSMELYPRKHDKSEEYASDIVIE